MAAAIAQKVIIQLVVMGQSHIIHAKRTGVWTYDTARKQSEHGHKETCMKCRFQSQNQ